MEIQISSYKLNVNIQLHLRAPAQITTVKFFLRFFKFLIHKEAFLHQVPTPTESFCRKYLGH